MHFVVLPGDGIGPEIPAATIQVLSLLNQRLNLDITFETHEIGLARLKKDGTTTPPSVIEAARKADGVVLGPVSHSDYPPRAQGGINTSGELRVQLALYANIRPPPSRDGLPPYRRTPMGLVNRPENTGAFYADTNVDA